MVKMGDTRNVFIILLRNRGDWQVKVRRLLFCIGSIYLFAWTGWAQTLSGRVMDEKGKGIAYVNVVLLERVDSSFVRGIVADENGFFQIENESGKERLLRFSAVGYQDRCTKALSGDVTLRSTAYAVGEVNILGKRPVYRMRGNSFITDVENSLLSDIGTASDLLRQIPGVRSDGEEFEVFGKGKAVIYINDRLVRDLSELGRMNSRDITSVELIDNPGASYDADTRAVLRIKTKRKRKGFASELRFQGSQNHYFSDMEQISLSYTTDRLNWHGSLNTSGPRSRVDGRNRITVRSAGSTYHLAMDMMDWKQYSRGYNAETGLGARLAEGHEAGVSYAYDYNRGVYEGSDIERFFAQGTMAECLDNYSYSKSESDRHKVNLYYMGEWFGELGVNWNADYIRRDAPTIDETTERSSLGENRSVSTSNVSLSDLYATKIVFDYPIGIGKLEFGMDMSKMTNQQTYANAEGYLPDSKFRSDERKVAGFVSYAGKVGKLDWSAGARYERFHASYFEHDGEEPSVDRVYKELYPAFSLSYGASPVSFSLSYSKRTSRPSFYQLRNSTDYTSRFLYARGNPYLRASQIHDVALNIGYRFLQFSVSYNQTKDWIRMTDELRQGDPLTIVLFHTNEPTFRKVSARLTFQHKIGLWNPIWTAGIRRDFWKLYDFKGERIHLDNPYGYFSLNNTFSLWKGILLNLDCFYATAGSIGESQKRPEAYIDIGLRKSFLKDALSVNLQYWDMFKSLDTQSIIYTEHIDYNRWNYSDSRCIRLTLTWYFNKYDNRYKGKNSAGSDIYRM